MFTMLSGIRLNSCNRPYLGSIASNLNPHGLVRPGRIPGSAPPSSANMPWLPHINRSARSGSGSSSGLPTGCGGGGGGGGGGKIRSLDIVLDKESRPVFEPGQEVAGKVVISTIGTLKFRSLAVSMRGVAKVHWTEGGQGVYSMTFNEEMEYFHKKKYVVSARNSGDSHLLPEGTHAFEFRFRLPDSPDLVTSFEGKFGSVRYFVRADLDQPWSFTHRAKKAFTLISPVDINTPQQQAPVSKEAEKAVCCCFLPWKRGQVAMNVSTDRRGYCPGESVALEALFSNGSGRRVRPTAALQQTQTFTAGGKTRRKRTTFAVLVGQSVLAGGDLTWDALPLKVPAVSPTIANCDFIRVEYAVKVSLVIPGGCDLTLSLPIVIGTVPHRPAAAAAAATVRLPSAASLMCRLPRHSAAAAAASAQRDDERGGRSGTPAPPYSECPPPQRGQQRQQHRQQHPSDDPPSYRECLDADAAVDLVEDGDFSETSSLYGDTRFVPLYRYVPDYLPPPAYAEMDPFPSPLTTGQQRQQQRQQHQQQVTTASLHEITLADNSSVVADGPRDSV